MRRIYLELAAVRMTGKSQHFERLIEDPQGYTRRNLKSREPGLQITDSLFDFLWFWKLPDVKCHFKHSKYSLFSDCCGWPHPSPVRGWRFEFLGDFSRPCSLAVKGELGWSKCLSTVRWEKWRCCMVPPQAPFSGHGLQRPLEGQVMFLILKLGHVSFTS